MALIEFSNELKYSEIDDEQKELIGHSSGIKYYCPIMTLRMSPLIYPAVCSAALSVTLSEKITGIDLQKKLFSESENPMTERWTEESFQDVADIYKVNIIVYLERHGEYLDSSIVFFRPPHKMSMVMPLVFVQTIDNFYFIFRRDYGESTNNILSPQELSNLNEFSGADQFLRETIVERLPENTGFSPRLNFSEYYLKPGSETSTYNDVFKNGFEYTVTGPRVNNLPSVVAAGMALVLGKNRVKYNWMSIRVAANSTILGRGRRNETRYPYFDVLSLLDVSNAYNVAFVIKDEHSLIAVVTVNKGRPQKNIYIKYSNGKFSLVAEEPVPDSVLARFNSVFTDEERASEAYKSTLGNPALIKKKHLDNPSLINTRAYPVLFRPLYTNKATSDDGDISDSEHVVSPDVLARNSFTYKFGDDPTYHLPLLENFVEVGEGVRRFNVNIHYIWRSGFPLSVLPSTAYTSPSMVFISYAWPGVHHVVPFLEDSEDKTAFTNMISKHSPDPHTQQYAIHATNGDDAHLVDIDGFVRILEMIGGLSERYELPFQRYNTFMVYSLMVQDLSVGSFDHHVMTERVIWLIYSFLMVDNPHIDNKTPSFATGPGNEPVSVFADRFFHTIFYSPCFRLEKKLAHTWIFDYVSANPSKCVIPTKALSNILSTFVFSPPRNPNSGYTTTTTPNYTFDIRTLFSDSLGPPLQLSTLYFHNQVHAIIHEHEEASPKFFYSCQTIAGLPITSYSIPPINSGGSFLYGKELSRGNAYQTPVLRDDLSPQEQQDLLSSRIGRALQYGSQKSPPSSFFVIQNEKFMKKNPDGSLVYTDIDKNTKVLAADWRLNNDSWKRLLARIDKVPGWWSGIVSGSPNKASYIRNLTKLVVDINAWNKAIIDVYPSQQLADAVLHKKLAFILPTSSSFAADIPVIVTPDSPYPPLYPLVFPKKRIASDSYVQPPFPRILRSSVILSVLGMELAKRNKAPVDGFIRALDRSLVTLMASSIFELSSARWAFPLHKSNFKAVDASRASFYRRVTRDESFFTIEEMDIIAKCRFLPDVIVDRMAPEPQLVAALHEKCLVGSASFYVISPLRKYDVPYYESAIPNRMLRISSAEPIPSPQYTLSSQFSVFYPRDRYVFLSKISLYNAGSSSLSSSEEREDKNPILRFLTDSKDIPESVAVPNSIDGVSRSPTIPFYTRPVSIKKNASLGSETSFSHTISTIAYHVEYKIKRCFAYVNEDGTLTLNAPLVLQYRGVREISNENATLTYLVTLAVVVNDDSIVSSAIALPSFKAVGYRYTPLSHDLSKRSEGKPIAVPKTLIGPQLDHFFYFSPNTRILVIWKGVLKGRPYIPGVLCYHSGTRYATALHVEKQGLLHEYADIGIYRNPWKPGSHPAIPYRPRDLTLVSDSGSFFGDAFMLLESLFGWPESAAEPGIIKHVPMSYVSVPLSTTSINTKLSQSRKRTPFRSMRIPAKVQRLGDEISDDEDVIVNEDTGTGAISPFDAYNAAKKLEGARQRQEYLDGIVKTRPAFLHDLLVYLYGQKDTSIMASRVNKYRASFPEAINAMYDEYYVSRFLESGPLIDIHHPAVVGLADHNTPESYEASTLVTHPPFGPLASHSGDAETFPETPAGVSETPTRVSETPTSEGSSSPPLDFFVDYMTDVSYVADTIHQRKPPTYVTDLITSILAKEVSDNGFVFSSFGIVCVMISENIYMLFTRIFTSITYKTMLSDVFQSIFGQWIANGFSVAFVPMFQIKEAFGTRASFFFSETSRRTLEEMNTMYLVDLCRLRSRAGAKAGSFFWPSFLWEPSTSADVIAELYSTLNAMFDLTGMQPREPLALLTEDQVIDAVERANSGRLFALASPLLKKNETGKIKTQRVGAKRGVEDLSSKPPSQPKFSGEGVFKNYIRVIKPALASHHGDRVRTLVQSNKAFQDAASKLLSLSEKLISKLRAASLSVSYAYFDAVLLEALAKTGNFTAVDLAASAMTASMLVEEFLITIPNLEQRDAIRKETADSIAHSSTIKDMDAVPSAIIAEYAAFSRPSSPDAVPPPIVVLLFKLAVCRKIQGIPNFATLDGGLAVKIATADPKALAFIDQRVLDPFIKANLVQEPGYTRARVTNTSTSSWNVDRFVLSLTKKERPDVVPRDPVYINMSDTDLVAHVWTTLSRDATHPVSWDVFVAKVRGRPGTALEKTLQLALGIIRSHAPSKFTSEYLSFVLLGNWPSKVMLTVLRSGNYIGAPIKKKALTPAAASAASAAEAAFPIRNFSLSRIYKGRGAVIKNPKNVRALYDYYRTPNSQVPDFVKKLVPNYKKAKTPKQLLEMLHEKAVKKSASLIGVSGDSFTPFEIALASVIWKTKRVTDDASLDKINDAIVAHKWSLVTTRDHLVRAFQESTEHLDVFDLSLVFNEEDVIAKDTVIKAVHALNWAPMTGTESALVVMGILLDIPTSVMTQLALASRWAVVMALITARVEMMLVPSITHQYIASTWATRLGKSTDVTSYVLHLDQFTEPSIQDGEVAALPPPEPSLVDEEMFEFLTSVVGDPVLRDYDKRLAPLNLEILEPRQISRNSDSLFYTLAILKFGTLFASRYAEVGDSLWSWLSDPANRELSLTETLDVHFKDIETMSPFVLLCAASHLFNKPIHLITNIEDRETIIATSIDQLDDPQPFQIFTDNMAIFYPLTPIGQLPR